MPAFYAHHAFGKRVRTLLSGEPAEIVCVHRKQFEIGLQGPDVLFFYRPYTGGGKVARYGHRLHEISAMPFFERALQTVERAGVDSREYAYLLGFICHFMLDSQCHGYVNRAKGALGVSHMEIEEEFEKYLLRLEGKDPLAYPLAALIPADQQTAETMAPFYEGIAPETALQALKDLRMVKKLFTAPGRVKHGALNTALRMTGHFGQLKGLMNQRKDNPKCRESNRELMRLFEEAVPMAVEMMQSFDESLRTGTELNERFARDFL